MVRNGPNPRFPAWAGLAAAVALCYPVTVLAESKPVIAVAPLSQGDNVPAGAGARFSEQIASELQARKEARVVGLPSAPAKPAATSKGAERGAQLLADGAKALSDLRFAAAISALRNGIEQSLSEPARADFPKVLDAYTQLAAAAFRTGDERTAQNALTQLAKLEPKFQPSDKYPPLFFREWEKAKARAQKLPRVKLTVEGPPGATGFIDGRDLGMVSVDEELPPGTHYVKVEGTRGELFGQVVELSSSPVTVKATFASAPVASSSTPEDLRIFGTLDGDAANRARAYSKATNAEYVVVGMLYRSGENQLTAATALYSAVKHGFVLLAPAALDRELSDAKSSAFGIADEVLVRVGSFGAPAPLPLSLSGRPTRTSAASLKPNTTPSAAFDPPSNRVATHALPANEARVTYTEPGVRWYWWVIGGVAVAAVTGGTIYGVTQATRPVTGTVSATW